MLNTGYFFCGESQYQIMYHPHAFYNYSNLYFYNYNFIIFLLPFPTGRDLTYERALQIVQNEEYLVAVDADLIRRRSDLGFG